MTITLDKRTAVARPDGTRDERYTVAWEYCGHETRRAVARFCEHWISCHATEAAAWAAAQSHKDGGASWTIREVNWHLRKEVTREAYLRDLVYAEDLKFPVHEWRGQDREGEPMVISWVTTGTGGALLSAYEIQGRA